MKRLNLFQIQKWISVSASLLFTLSASAQRDNPFVLQQDQKVLDREAIAFLDSGKELVQDAADSTVGVYFQGYRLTYGTVVAEDLIATKWSEIDRVPTMLRAVGRDGEIRSLSVAKVLQDHDLALLRFTGKSLPVLRFSDDKQLTAGDFLLVPRSDGEVASAGVVSVLPRSLRPEDAGFLGVQMSDGRSGVDLVVNSLVEGGAAELAGVQPGDEILEVDSQEIDNFSELQNVLKRSGAGETVNLIVKRGDETIGIDAILQGSANQISDLGRFQELDQRSKRMQQMGLGRLSKRSEGYPRVMQTDLDVEAEDCGAPVVDLDGDAVGIIISRASRIKTYVLPADVVAGAVQTLQDGGS